MEEEKNIKVDWYCPSKGGFMQPVVIQVPFKIYEQLLVKNALLKNVTGKVAGESYWDAIKYIKERLAGLTGISGWEESMEERTKRGDPNAPISIIDIRKNETEFILNNNINFMTQKKQTNEETLEEFSNLKEEEFSNLEKRVEQLEEQLSSSGLHSTSFWTRALAVFGHYLAVYAIFVGVFLALGLLASLLG